ncbi:MAG: hypothetical protein KIS62_15085 [Ramlibacter sp.]|nr:hypothetical protein [Ramlibacter sp.]
MKDEEQSMKLLRILDSTGHFLSDDNQFLPIDRITKDDLLRLANLTLNETDVEFDEYDEKVLKNQAHRVIYKNVVQKLRDLHVRKKEFADQAARLFYEDYERYRQE